jgi:hypothetical protein
MVFTAAHHYKLPWLSFGDNLGCLDPQKVDTGHNLLIGADFSYDLLQLLTFFVLSRLSMLIPTFKDHLKPGCHNLKEPWVGWPTSASLPTYSMPPP